MFAIHRAAGRGLLIAAAMLGSATSGGTEQPPATLAAQRCTAAEHRQFDFWIGSWTVTQGGKPAGHNRIESVLDGCALLESWSGTSGTNGHSLSFYDQATGKWHQTWVDSDGGVLNLNGSLVDGVMTLEETHRDPATGKDVRDRIRWSQVSDGVVRQVWDRASLPGGAWEPVFDGRYEREAAAPRDPK